MNSSKCDHEKPSAVTARERLPDSQYLAWPDRSQCRCGRADRYSLVVVAGFDRAGGVSVAVVSGREGAPEWNVSSGSWRECRRRRIPAEKALFGVAYDRGVIPGRGTGRPSSDRVARQASIFFGKGSDDEMAGISKFLPAKFSQFAHLGFGSI